MQEPKWRFKSIQQLTCHRKPLNSLTSSREACKTTVWAESTAAEEPQVNTGNILQKPVCLRNRSTLTWGYRELLPKYWRAALLLSQEAAARLGKNAVRQWRFESTMRAAFRDAGGKAALSNLLNEGVSEYDNMVKSIFCSLVNKQQLNELSASEWIVAY